MVNCNHSTIDCNTQHAPSNYLETCKATIDDGCFADALLMDLSKALTVQIMNYHKQNYMHMT